MPPSTDRKRKRDSHVSFALPEDVKLKIATDNDLPPLLATTPGFQLSPSTSFEAYSRPRPSKKRKDSKTDEVEYLIHGENERIDYEGRELEEETDIRKHYLGVYDPNTGELQVYQAPKLNVTRDIKALREKDREAAETRTDVDVDNRNSRNVLGIEFGTKKSKKNIERRDLNKVIVEDMDKEVTSAIVDQIGENTEAMPTKEQLAKTHNENRQIPPVHENVDSPQEVYDINDIVSPDELAGLNIGKWLKEGTANGGKILIPGQSHITNRINQLGLLKDPTQQNKRKLRILRYVGYLKDLYVFLAEKKGSQYLLSSGKDHEIHNRTQIPRELLEGLLNRYTGIMGGVTTGEEKGNNIDRPKRIATPSHLAKLLNYMAILCLMVEENFGVDVYYLKDDLGLQTRELLTVFSSVGCKKKDLTQIQAVAFDISKAEMKHHKIAYLTAKPEFPKAPIRRIGGRR